MKQFFTPREIAILLWCIYTKNRARFVIIAEKNRICEKYLKIVSALYIIKEQIAERKQ